MKKNTTLFIVYFLLISFSYSQNLESTIKEEFEKLKLVSIPNFDVDLEISDYGKMISLREEQKIIFSKEQFSKFAANLSYQSREYLVRILLAHELAHQFQFNWYKGKIELQDTPILRMLLEEQADILSGYCFGYLLILDNIAENNFSLIGAGGEDFNIDDIYSLFELILEIGVEENTIGTHPSRNDRLMGFKLGMDIGMIQYLKQFAKSKPHLYTRNDIEKFNRSLKEAYEIHDYDYLKENIFNWSYKISKKIINVDTEAVKSIVFMNDPKKQRIKWHTTIDYPFVDYDFDYINISEKPIYVEMEIYTSHVDRKDKKLEKYHSKRNSDIFKFVINPKKIKNIKGRLRWDKMKNDDFDLTALPNEKMPRIVFPSIQTNSAWISCSFIDEKPSTQTSQEVIDFLSFGKIKDKSISKFKLGRKILSIISDFKYKPKKLSVGTGQYRETNNPHPLITYNSPVVFDNRTQNKMKYIFHKKTELYSDSFVIEYDDFNSKSNAVNKFNTIIDAFDLALNKYTKEVDIFNEDERVITYIKDNLYIEVAVYKFRYRDSNEYFWRLEIEIT
ncbi:hypothetical protein [Winogradskyella haliclonae]|nr:hypothetical protein [Winogradskyella haliclonae]